VLTRNTHLLLADYLKKSNPTVLDYGEPLESEGYTLTLYPAGHCLGSSQILIESKTTGERVLYTGDFKSRPSPVNEPLAPVSCDTLIIEATYGKPEYIFPPEEQVLETAFRTLHNWMSKGERPVVLGWRLGKSQEVLHYLLSQGFDVVVEPSVYEIAQVYEEASVEFPGHFRAFDGAWAEGEVLLCPPGRWAGQELRGFLGKRSMELTGWAANGRRRWGRRGDAILPYSDHADFNDLVDYVEQVAPKRVYTVNGFPDLAAHLRQLGYAAVHLDKQGRASDDSFQMKLL
jgi:Cft2 family RNA processing exonuclease